MMLKVGIDLEIFDIIERMNWCFAIVNGKLAEIFFDRKRGKSVIAAHCYVKKSGYKTAQEKRWILSETKKFRFIWRNKKYTRVLKKDN
ncbi:MAG: hypothetical protein Q7S05_04755 [bacterium]|nr:hypothetical protein [bacterium]